MNVANLICSGYCQVLDITLRVNSFLIENSEFKGLFIRSLSTVSLDVTANV